MMSNNVINHFPRVLIVGQDFNKTSGGGITLSNLFKNWDKNSIAVIPSKINYCNDICEKYYQIGNLENKRPFPFNYIRLKVKSGGIIINQKNKSISQINNKNYLLVLKKIYLVLNSIIFSLLKFLDLSNFIYRWEVSDELIKWIKEFKPDILYTQLSNLVLIRFVQNIYNRLKLPIAIHIMDDWPQTINKGSLLSIYWRKKIDKEFRHLLDSSQIFLCISQAMSDEYKRRYNKPFIPFHNPIELDKWLPYTRTDWKITGTFKILYAGRIGKANSLSVFDICQAVNNLVKQGLNIILEIYTVDFNTKIANQISKFLGVRVNTPVPHEKMSQLLSNFDLLVLPLDFSINGIKFAKFSMPTKTSEYMISGTPILIYAPHETALYKYGAKYNWGYLVGQRDLSQLYDAIKRLYQDENLRKNFGEIAKKLAMEKHNATNVRKQFREILNINSN